MLNYEQLETIQKKLQKHMGTKRYRHTIGVQYTSVMLAMRYEVDLQKAALAGLLHDCAKCLEEEQMLKECDRNHIKYSSTEKKQPYLLHAQLGACYARKKYDIEDGDILSAIRYHTTGRAEMTILEKIIFTADYMEPHRKMLPHLPAIRKMAFEDIDEAVYMILRDTIDYLKEDTQKEKTADSQKQFSSDLPDKKNATKKKKEIETHTLQAYEYYEQLHLKKTLENN